MARISITPDNDSSFALGPLVVATICFMESSWLIWQIEPLFFFTRQASWPIRDLCDVQLGLIDAPLDLNFVRLSTRKCFERTDATWRKVKCGDKKKKKSNSWEIIIGINFGHFLISLHFADPRPSIWSGYVKIKAIKTSHYSLKGSIMTRQASVRLWSVARRWSVSNCKDCNHSRGAS